MENLDQFVKRLKKLDINIELMGNYPWIYLEHINGKLVKEKHQSLHGFTIGFLIPDPANSDQAIVKFEPTSVIFGIIRKYINNDKSRSNNHRPR